MKNKRPSQKHKARIEHIKKVALELFLSQGYQQTSLAEIIALAGGSFSCIYETYKSKEGLFLAILSDIRREHFDFVSARVGDIREGDLRTFLLSFSQAFMEIITQEQSRLLGKIMYSQIYYKKQMSEWVRDNEEHFLHNILTEHLAKEGPQVAARAEKLGRLFCVMLKEPLHQHGLLTGEKTMSKIEQKQHAKFCVEIFLSGILSLK